MVETNFPKLDVHEEHFRIPSHHNGLSLFLRYLPPFHGTELRGNVVLYVHGGTFPSSLSIAHRFDGRSWRDELAASGFHCWGLDFHGFGRFSDPYPEMAEPAENHAPLGRAEDASRQLEQAVRFICAHHRVPRISLIAHSWGSIVSGRFAGRHPRLVERLVYFGPIAWRAPRADSQRLSAWRLISLKDQWDRFTADVPPRRAAGVVEASLRRMGRSLSRHRSREPHALAAGGKDAKRRLSGHLRRLGRRACLRSSVGPRAGRDHPRRMGRHVHGRGCQLAVPRPDIIADPTHGHRSAAAPI